MVTFYVKNTGNTQSSIFCSINYTGVGRVVIKVPNSKINVKEWKDGWIKTGRGKQENSQTETYLNGFKSKVENFYTEFVAVKKVLPKKEDFINYLNSNKELKDYFPKTTVIKVVPIIKKIIENRKSGKELNKGRLYSAATIKQYNSFLVRLEEFAKLKKIEVTSQDVISKNFVPDLQSYFTVEKKGRLNAVSNNMKMLRLFLNILLDNDFIPYNPFNKFKYSVTWERGVGIALDEEEMDALFNLDLSNDPKHEKARDQFMVLCLTGLRVSDLNEFIEIRKDGDVVIVDNKKTKGVSYIPMFKQLGELLDKYNGRFSKLISDQKLGEYLKEIGKEMPLLQRPHQTTFTKGGKTVKEFKPRYKYLSSHVGRRTLATYLANIGVEYHIIQLITGHKNLRDLETYLRVDKRNVMKGVIEKVNENKKKLHEELQEQNG